MTTTLAMVVLCIVALAQLVLQSAWSIRNARVAREQSAELEQLSRRVESRGGLEALEILGALKAVRKDPLLDGKRDTLTELAELIREHDLLERYLAALNDAVARLDVVERQLGIIRWLSDGEEPSPNTQRS
jgi:hypothetical protein